MRETAGAGAVLLFSATLIAVAGSNASQQGSPPSPSPSAAGPETLVPGDIVPPFDAEGVDGAFRRIAYPRGSSTLLLFFLSSCPTCHRMIPQWNRAYDRRPANLTVIGVMMDQEPPGFFMATPISFPVVRLPGKALALQYRIRHVPLTVRIGPGGRVEDVAQGALDAIRLGELFHP